MISMRLALFGLVALASAGCATGMHMAGNGNGHGAASPATYEVQKCDGWYDNAAAVCDSVGD